MATRPPMMPPLNETEHTVNRATREGKIITYKLSVMQQPERARACGAGAKSSADRRPVDPPPVVELRIYESDPNDDLPKTDITFAYNANFFLFATLETARPIAHGRVAGPPTCPVLTGVPVAGVAYLDRPSQAGYFIFPDLSVRHEGRYRLSFHLYEEIKDPKDADKDAPMQNTNAQPLNKASVPQSSLNFRLEVKSIPFTVYSAKKFPGLATSTSLSRIIAEQGCRVRIRRDVRMRRRGEKRADDFDFDEERVYAPPPRPTDHRFSTPDTSYAAATPIERPRSTSTSTVDPAFPYGPDPQRRPSMPEYGFPVAQPYQRPMPAGPPAPAPPAAAPHASPYSSHLSFGPGQSPYHQTAPQLPPTPQSAAPANPYSPHFSYTHTRNSSSNGTEYEPVVYPYPQPRPTEQPSYPKTPLPPLRLDPPKGLVPEGRPSDPNGYPSLAQPPVPRSQTPSAIRMPSLPPLSALPTRDYLSTVAQSPSQPEAALNKQYLFETPGSKLTKRPHEESFGIDERPLHNGMRPDSEEYPSMQRKLSESSRATLFGPPGDNMSYKRANGRVAMKLPPALP